MTTLPHWNLDQYFPGMESDAFVTEFDALREDIRALAEQIETLTADDAADPVSTYDTIIGQVIALQKRMRVLGAYISGHLAVNSRDNLAAKRMSEFSLGALPLTQAMTRFTAWIGKQDADALVAASDLAREHEYLIRREQIGAQHLMSPAEEDLAAELTLSGGSAWGRLHGNVTSQIMVDFEQRPGEHVSLPMSAVRNLASDPDRDVRRRAFEAELAAWNAWSTPLAAALNGVKGEHTTNARKRGWDEVLDQALFQNQIDRETLDAMLSAAEDAYPDIRRYWAAKAKALGIDKLAWYDIFAPAGTDEREWSWDEGTRFVIEQFDAFSTKMGDLARQSFDEEWVDAEPRPGKRDGAFCMGTTSGKSGVMMNFNNSFDSVSTLAHELGHAYHNLASKDSSILWRSSTPMTLAETASTFCETILRKAAIEQGTEDEQFTILNGGLIDAGQIVVDISSRFRFEKAVFERRRHGELSVDDFKELMIQSQKETYGDAIDADALHPFMWAVKGHYYSVGRAFYNYPYMFGLLFGLGLYARYTADPDAFRANYDDLLASTGSADAATLASRFGIDIRDKAFWASSLDVIREDVDRFCELVDVRMST